MATYPPPVQIQKKRSGCSGCGCVLVIILLLVALLAVGCYALYQMTRDYTDSAAGTVPVYNGGEKVFQPARQKLITFQNAIEHGSPASLRLSANEINTLIATDSSFAAAKGHVFVAFKGNQATVQSSLLLGSVESSLFTDRYLNGDLTFTLNFDPSSKSLDLELQGEHIKGHDLPPHLNETFNSWFSPIFNQKIQAHPIARDFLSHVKKLTIENSQLVIETQ